jgi:hypothetical protein
MTLERNEPLGARSILVSWLKAGWKTGVILGGTYGAVYAALATEFFPFVLIGLALGCVIGFVAGLVAGVINGAVISALTGPFALRRGSPPLGDCAPRLSLSPPPKPRSCQYSSRSGMAPRSPILRC